MTLAFDFSAPPVVISTSAPADRPITLLSEPCAICQGQIVSSVHPLGALSAYTCFVRMQCLGCENVTFDFVPKPGEEN